METDLHNGIYDFEEWMLNNNPAQWINQLEKSE